MSWSKPEDSRGHRLVECPQNPADTEPVFIIQYQQCIINNVMSSSQLGWAYELMMQTCVRERKREREGEDVTILRLFSGAPEYSCF